MATLVKAPGNMPISTDRAQAKVLRVYWADRPPDGASRGWLSVVRLSEYGELRLFLRDGKGYRVIPQAIALSLLSKPDQRSLLAILKRDDSGGGKAINEKNCIRRMPTEQKTDKPRKNVAGCEDKEGVKNSSTEYGNQLESEDIFSASRSTGGSWPSFKDYGGALATNSSSAGVADSLVRIAHARGWSSIRVSGSEAFRHAVWRVAVVRGMRVRGYFPLAPAKASLAMKAAPSETQHKSKPESPQRAGERSAGARPGSVGKSLLEMGKALPQVPADNAVIPRHPKVYSAWVVDAPVLVDNFTAYEQAVVMARIYENLSQDVEHRVLPTSTSQAADVKAMESGIATEATLEQTR